MRTLCREVRCKEVENPERLRPLQYGLAPPSVMQFAPPTAMRSYSITQDAVLLHYLGVEALPSEARFVFPRDEPSNFQNRSPRTILRAPSTPGTLTRSLRGKGKSSIVAKNRLGKTPPRLPVPIGRTPVGLRQRT